ncbi:MAG TPA: HAMP domain-containing histidine kinase [Sedimenticola sp.]|nr:HAMP domain-containing histidine kinase [Sedimenticola sp.]
MGLPDTIYPRIFIPFLLALALVSLSAWWLASTLFANALQQQREQQLESAIEVLAEGNLPLTPALLQRLGRLLQARLVLIGADGAPLPPTVAALPPPLARALDQVWDQHGAGRYAAIRPIDGIPHSILIRPLAQESDNRFRAIAAIAGLSELQQVSRGMARNLGLVLLAGTLVLAWLVHKITVGLTGPIAGLAGFADRIARGDLEARTDTTGPRELARLARALNDMATQLQGYQRKMAEQNRLQALGEMSARVAHEIRNPLTAIKLQIQLLGEEPALGETQRRRVDRLLAEIRRLELVVSGTLMLGRKLEATLRPVDLDDLVREMAELLQPQLQHRGIALELALGAVPTVRADPDHIRQVLFNLVNNAADELTTGGTLRIGSRVAASGDRVALWVEDSGPGIPAAQRERLFRNTGSDKPHGLGIGLAVSRELLQLQGGTLAVDHSRELGGACFRILLPLPGNGEKTP